MNTGEKVQVIALAAIFLFLAYVTMLAVDQALQEKNVARPSVTAPPAPAPAPEPVQEEKKATQSEKKDAERFFSKGRLKARAGDCTGAQAEFQKAVSLDQSFSDQVPAALDSCTKK